MKTEAKNAMKTWRIDEDRRLWGFIKENKRANDIALLFDRSEGSVKSRIRLMTFSKTKYFKQIKQP